MELMTLIDTVTVTINGWGMGERKRERDIKGFDIPLILIEFGFGRSVCEEFHTQYVTFYFYSHEFTSIHNLFWRSEE